MTPGLLLEEPQRLAWDEAGNDRSAKYIDMIQCKVLLGNGARSTRYKSAQQSSQNTETVRRPRVRRGNI